MLHSRLEEGQTILQKKSHGWLIHVSDFINEENGCLVILNADGNDIVPEEDHACKIIFPGAAGDPWCNTAQLLDQMHTKAIPIFKKAFPGAQGLFIFDQSSAHASLSPMLLI